MVWLSLRCFAIVELISWLKICYTSRIVAWTALDTTEGCLEDINLIRSNTNNLDWASWYLSRVTLRTLQRPCNNETVKKIGIIRLIFNYTLIMFSARSVVVIRSVRSWKIFFLTTRLGVWSLWGRSFRQLDTLLSWEPDILDVIEIQVWKHFDKKYERIIRVFFIFNKQI